MSDSSPTAALADLCPALRAAFLRHDYSVDGLADALGPAAVAALDRSDAAGVRRAARGAGPVGTLVRLFVLGDRLPATEVAEVLDGLDLDAAVHAGLLEHHDEGVRSLLDVRPLDLGEGIRWVFSDVDGSMVHTTTRPDHVLGVGQASLSLLRVTPTSPVDSLLDLGTGCGVQLLGAAATTPTCVGTDITPRCLDLATATLAINDLDAELVRGPWFEPVTGRRFDRIVSNPPFVVGTTDVAHSYRESGLALDGASRTVVSGAAEHLTPGGTAVFLCSWVETAGEDWRSRVAGWVPAEGVDAWVLRRDSSDPELYVWTWLTDEGMDPRDPATAEAADRWLGHFAAEGVTGVGFGYVYLRRVDGPSSVLCEDLTHPFDDGLGDEAEAYFARTAWLRDAALRHGDEAAALDATVFAVSPDVRVHESARPVDEAVAAMDPDSGPAPSTLVVERTTGARWRHEIDAPTRTLLRGLATASLPFADVVTLAAAAHGLDPEDLSAPARAVLVDLLRHGVVLPAGLDAGLTPRAREVSA